MKISSHTLSLCLATTLGLSPTNNILAAQTTPPATLEEMWKIIQQQQKEIESLKAKAAKSDAVQAETNSQKEPSPLPAKALQASASPQPQPVAVSTKTDAERKTDILASEVENLKTRLFIPETREYKSQFGLGPAASGVYRVNRGLSIGGYGEAMYTNYANPRGNNLTNKDSADLERAVIYLGYKFNDWVILNNEIEFEHATTGEGSEEKGEVSVEFSQLDFLLNPKYNIRAGLMLVPMGFINEMHEPTTYHGNRRPDVERFIIPSTWREMGAGLFGEILPGLEYRVYAMNGLNAQEFGSAGIAEGRQGGSNAKAEDFAVAGRLDYSPTRIPGLMVGASTFMGNSGQKNALFNNQQANIFTQLYEGHIQYKYRGLELRALGAWGKISDTNLLNPQLANGPVGKENFGGYVETAYDIMPFVWKDSSQYLAPFLRVERYNTMASVANGFDSSVGLDRWIYQAGLSYKPIDNIVIKADYRNINDRKIVPNGIPNGDEFNLGLGFIY